MSAQLNMSAQANIMERRRPAKRTQRARRSFGPRTGGEWDLENEAIPATPLTGLSEDEARGYFDTSSADTSEDDNPPTILTAKRQTFRASTWIDSYGAEPSPTRERAMEEIRHEVHHPSLPIKKVEPVVDPSRFSIDSWVAGQDRKPTPVAKSFMSSEPLPRPARSSSSRRTSMVKQSPSRPTSARKTSSSSRPGSRPNSGHKQSDSISEAIVPLPATMLFPTTPTRSSFKTKSSQPPKSPVLSPTVHPIKDSDLPPLPTSRTSLPSPPANLRELRLSSGSSRKPASRSHSRRGSRETRSVQHSRAPSEVTSISTVAQSLQIPAEVYINRDSPSPHSLARKNSSSSLQQYWDQEKLRSFNEYNPFVENTSRFSDEKPRPGLPLPATTPKRNKSIKRETNTGWWTKRRVITAALILLVVAALGAGGAVIATVVL